MCYPRPRFVIHNFSCMPKSTDVQTHRADVPLAVEIESSNVAVKIETSIMKKNFKNRQTLQIVRSLGFGKVP